MVSIIVQPHGRMTVFTRRILAAEGWVPVSQLRLL